MDASEEVTVTYTVRDLLAEIRDDVKAVKHQLDNKVDKTDFIKLDVRVSELERVRWKIVGFSAAAAALLGAAGFSLERLIG